MNETASLSTQKTVTDYITGELLDAASSVVIAPDDNLLMNGIIDSLGIMQLVTFIESEFAVSVPPQDVTIEHFMTVDHITRYIAKQQS